MSYRAIRLFPLAAALLILAVVATAAAPGTSEFDPKTMMPLSQVRAGMKGYGLTVFHGTKIEKFDVNVLGILRKVNTGKDLILIRVNGGPVTQRQANIMHGMSGSPVYINGRLVGAVSYTFPTGFSREPIGMMTPIADMLDSLDPKLPPRPAGLCPPTAAAVTPFKIGGETYNNVEIQKPSYTGKPPKGTLVMSPIMTPVMVSGISGKGMRKLAELLEPFGLEPMAGPGGKTDPVPVDFQPGASVGMSLATGDVDLSAIGTLTYRNGNKVVGFGHPFLGVGPIDAPMTTAYVHDIFSSYQDSNKIASSMKTIGRVFQDRPWSIGGEIGQAPQMVPVTIDVDDHVTGRKKTLHIQTISHPLIVSRLLMIVAAEAITDVHGFPSDAIARVKMDVDADQIGKIERENVFFDPTDLDGASTEDFGDLLSLLAGNRFYPVAVKSAHLSVVIESGRKTAVVERIYVDKTKYEPGETVDVGVELRPYRGEKVVKTVQVKVPEDAPDGRITLSVRGGPGGGGGGGPIVISLGGSGGPPMMGGPGGSTANAESVKQLVNKYLEQPKNNELVARLTMTSTAVSVDGEKFAGLPASIANVMKSPKSSSVKQERDEVKTVLPMDYALTGGQTLSLNVGRRRVSERKPPAGAPSEPQSPPDGIQPSQPVSIDIDDGSFDDSEGAEWRAPIALGSGPQLDKPSEPPAVPPTLKPHGLPPEGPTPAGKPVTSPTSKPDEKPVAAAEKPSATAEKPVGRQPVIWKQASLADFSTGTFDGTAATSADDVRLAPELSKLASLPETYVWKVVPDGKGGVYAGTGDKGLIYRVGKDGSSAVFYKTGELEVNGLAVDSKGVLYAGTSPNGKVFRIASDGSGEIVFDAPEEYILALAVDSKDNVYAAAGDGGTIYKITPDGKSGQFVKLTEDTVLALAVDKSDNVYAGAGKDGIIYKITPDGSQSAIYDAQEDPISSLAVDSAGNVYAGTGIGKGNIYKIAPDGATDTVYDKAPHALSLVVDSADNVYGVSDEQIFKITPDKTVMSLDTKRSGAQFVSIAVDGAAVVAGTANNADVYRSSGEAKGTFDSVAHDSGSTSRWGNISWTADTPPGTSVTLRTRSGNVAEPDSTWSGWSADLSSASGQTVQSPPGRYIQYRATATGTDSAAPVLKQVTVACLTANKPPKVKITDPQTGAAVSRTVAVKWSGTDLDKDTLSYDLYYSGDSGKSWQPLGSGLKQAANGADKPAQPAITPAAGATATTPVSAIDGESGDGPNAQELVSQVKAGLDSHPEIPQAVKDKLLADAPAAADKAADAASKPAEEPSGEDTGSPAGANGSTKQTTFSWDTAKVPDGSYMIKVVASDRISNATGFLTDSKTMGPITVVNKPPTITALGKELKANADKTVTVTGFAIAGPVPIAGVQFKVDTGDWMAAAPTDGMFDSTNESFVVATLPQTAGKHTIEIKAIDAAGNSASTKVTATVP